MVPDDNEQKEIVVGVRDYRNSANVSNNEDIILRNLMRNKEKKQKRESASAVKIKERPSTNNHSVVNQRRNSWMERRERHSQRSQRSQRSARSKESRSRKPISQGHSMSENDFDNLAEGRSRPRSQMHSQGKNRERRESQF